MSDSATEEVKAFARRLSTAQLVEAFEATDTDNRPEIPTVRGWLMDELEARNPDAFGTWMDEEPANGSPRPFFL